MKFLLDLLPVILFFATYKLTGSDPAAAHAFASRWLGDGIGIAQAPILIATAVAIIATVAQILWVRLRHGKVDTMLWVSLVIVSVFGGATLVLHDATFIKWKPTVLYWLFAAVLGGSMLLGRNPIKRMMEAAQLNLPDAVWSRMNLAWALFFAFMGALNLYVAYGYAEETWVNFKLFGGMGLMLAFGIAQSLYLSKYIQEDQH